MTNNTVTMPDYYEIIRRLSTVNAEPQLVGCFYPKIAKKAGTKYIAPGLITMFTLAIEDYIDYLGLVGIDALSCRVDMHGDFANWIDALDLEDKEIVDEAKAQHTITWGF